MNNEFLRRCLLLSSTCININHYLTISSREDGLTVKFNGVDDIEYCINGKKDWNTLSSGSYTPAINAGDYISFRGNLVPTDTGIGNFTINKDCDLMGNCNSLLFGDYACETYDLSGYDYAFCELFSSCGTIINVSPKFLPATTLAESCYESMFHRCTSLETAPILPATTLASYCYRQMFNGTSLTTAPELPATTLADNCYVQMFYNCTKLTTAPELPATTLVNNCYQQMFYGCSSLTTAPELPATTLASYCYGQMFYNCPKLNKITMYATNITANACLSNWVRNVATSGTFIKHPDMTSLPTGVNGIPSGWIVISDTYK